MEIVGIELFYLETSLMTKEKKIINNFLMKYEISQNFSTKNKVKIIFTSYLTCKKRNVSFITSLKLIFSKTTNKSKCFIFRFC